MSMSLKQSYSRLPSRGAWINFSGQSSPHGIMSVASNNRIASTKSAQMTPNSLGYYSPSFNGFDHRPRILSSAHKSTRGSLANVERPPSSLFSKCSLRKTGDGGSFCLSKSSSIDQKRLKYLSSQTTLADYNETLNSVTKDLFGEEDLREAAARGAKRSIRSTLRKQKKSIQEKGVVATITDRKKTFASPMESFDRLHGNKVQQIKTLQWKTQGRFQCFNSILEQSNELHRKLRQMPAVRIGPPRASLTKTRDFLKNCDQTSGRNSEVSLGKAVNIKKKNAQSNLVDSEGNSSDSQGEGQLTEMKRQFSFSKIDTDNPMSEDEEVQQPRFKKKKDEMGELVKHCRTLEQMNKRMFKGGKPMPFPQKRSHFQDDTSSEEEVESQYPPFSITPINTRARHKSVEIKARTPAGEKVIGGMEYNKANFKKFYQQRLKNKSKRFFTSFHNLQATTWKPESREASILLGIRGYAYLFGGKNRSLLERIQKLKIAPHPESYQKEKEDDYLYEELEKTAVSRKASMMSASSIIEMNDPMLFEKFQASWGLMTPVQGSDQINGRFGHSGCSLKKRYLFYFGGERRYNAKVRIRECLNDLICYDIKLNQWGIVRTKGPVIKSRKYCCMANVGQLIIIHGGIDDFGNYLQDVCIFDLVNRTWRILPQPGLYNEYKQFESSLSPDKEDPDAPLKCEVTGCSSIGMAGCCGVFYNHRARERINPGLQLTEPRWGKVEHFVSDSYQQIRYQGIYVFGGKMGPSEETNQLKVLKFANKRMKWILPRISGRPPEPRYQHSMDFYKRGNCLIIHGGRCDNFGGRVYNDMFVLKLEDKLDWVKVIYERQVPTSLFNHSSCIIGDHLLAYGGMKNGYKISNELRLFQLEQGHMNKKLNSFKEKLKKVFFNAIMKDYMHNAKLHFQREIEERISQSRKTSVHTSPRQEDIILLH